MPSPIRPRFRLALPSVLVVMGLGLGCVRAPDPTADSNPHATRTQNSPRQAPLPSLPKSAQTIAKAIGFSAAQDELLRRQGLMVRPSDARLGRVPSQIYDALYQRDLPVLITSDSILYAFHRNYQQLLKELEEEHLHALLKRVLLATRKRLVQALQRGEWGDDKARLAQELDLFLSVPLRLLGAPKKPGLASSPGDWLTTTISKIYSEQSAPIQVLGKATPEFDFSVFRPRAHYTLTPKLEAYFRAITWLAQFPVQLQSSTRAGTVLNQRGWERAVALSWLVQESGELESYRTLARVMNAFVGSADDESPASMMEFLSDHGIATVSQLAAVNSEQRRLWLASNAKTQSRINNQRLEHPGLTLRKPPPRNFLVLGQRYTLDSEVFQNLVYDRLEDPRNPGQPLLRKLPLALDIAAALGNPRAKVHLQEEFKRYPYQAALEEQAQRIRALPPSFWTQSVHSAWLYAVASLGTHAQDPRRPKVFQSPAWQDKTLNTQLASWAELRHDHILYAKQPKSNVIGCEFPDAYVEPVPHTFAAIKTLVSKLHAIVHELQEAKLKVNPKTHEQLLHFSSVLDTLQAIATKELDRSPLTQEEQRFLKRAVESEGQGYGDTRWDGWYPKLTGVVPNVVFEPTIADVHTDPPDITNGFSQRVLHAGTGAFELATVVVDCSPTQRCAYVGPVSSFYELVSPNRLNNQEWVFHVDDHPEIGRPWWTRSYRSTGRPTPNPSQ